MNEIPEDLKRRTSGHGFNYGCECDLQGGDPMCKIQPPYETIEAYCVRLLEHIFVLGQERDELVKTVGRLSAPVEAIDFAGHLHPGSNSLPEIMNKINAARLNGNRT